MNRKGFLCVAMVLGILMAAAVGAWAFYAGSYQGTFIGDNYGAFEVTVGQNGEISGLAHSNKLQRDFPLAGQVGPEGIHQFSTPDGALVFSGSVDQVGRLMGRWGSSDGAARGNFTALLRQ